MNFVLKNFVENNGFEIPAAVELVTKNPALELGVFNRLGSLEVGKVADFAVFDFNFNIKLAAVNGEILK